MKKVVWMLRWASLRPSLSGDEWYRRTLVVPIPFGSTVGDDGDRDWPALVIAVAPWWACREALRRDYREYVRWERDRTVAQYAVIDDDVAWNLVYDAFERTRPPEPASL
ncbi:hypothetical protein CZ771_09540 [Actinomycetales bacterium JB111]|nr:hypothetical protein CZ771_09540 [Actinomycetales bacterium JB111]